MTQFGRSHQINYHLFLCFDLSLILIFFYSTVWWVLWNSFIYNLRLFSSLKKVIYNYFLSLQAEVKADQLWRIIASWLSQINTHKHNVTGQLLAKLKSPMTCGRAEGHRTWAQSLFLTVSLDSQDSDFQPLHGKLMFSVKVVAEDWSLLKSIIAQKFWEVTYCNYTTLYDVGAYGCFSSNLGTVS